VAAEAASARSRTRLVPAAEGPGPASWQPAWSGPETPVLAIAYAAADLLTGPRATSVNACSGVGCGWLFSDPRGRRRWCEMAVCGNRAKARRHRQGR
jgi:predicted RNA-binding Zn ribbon-like protein